MKTIEVVAAIIKQGKQILATKRGYGEFEGGWEFPGGKIEAGEEKVAAIIREIKEELDATIMVDQFVLTTEYDYPNFHLIMHCYLCSIPNEHISLLEHSDAKWLTKDTLDSVEWLPADVAVVEKIKEML